MGERKRKIKEKFCTNLNVNVGEDGCISNY